MQNFKREIAMKMNKSQGFTLIELLVIIAIMGVLFALLVPAIASTRERANTANCLNNMKQLALAAFMYADDHAGEAIPEVSETSDYIDNERVYICPRDTRLGLGAMKPSYAACTSTPNSLLPADANGLFSETILYLESDQSGEAGYDRTNIIAQFEHEAGAGEGYIEIRHDNRTVIVFADGHIFSMSEDQLIPLLTGGEEEEPL